MKICLQDLPLEKRPTLLFQLALLLPRRELRRGRARGKAKVKEKEREKEKLPSALQLIRSWTWLQRSTQE